MANQEFNIKSRKENFRITPNISAVDLLALSTSSLNLTNFTQTKELFKYSLEHTEVQMGDKWFPVKTIDKEVYMPLDIEKNLVALQEICSYFMEEVILKAFQKSSE